jgi:transposase InsO family protein
MRSLRLSGLVPKRYRRTTIRVPGVRVADDLVERRFVPADANELWCADIKYVRSWQGFLYLAAVMDLYSRQILGWSLWENLETGGPLQALARAMVKRGNPQGVIHHSDRGIQYASALYREQLLSSGLIASMSRKGNCYDNAAMEAFWSTLKREALEQSPDWSKDRVRRVLFQYIESVYNRQRLHSSLGYKSPVDFEQTNN